MVEREAALLDPGDREELVARVAERSFGLGPLEPLLRDPEVDEVWSPGCGRCGLNAAASPRSTAVRFATEADLRHAIERILPPLGRRVDEAEPLCDARLPDGSRVNVVLPPLALDGPGAHDPALRAAQPRRRRPRRPGDRGRPPSATSSPPPSARA
jgi:pilus assembly protein CpaF